MLKTRQPGQVLDHEFINRVHDRFEEFGERCARFSSATSSNNQASRKEQIEEAARDLHRIRTHDLLLGDGPDAAQERGRQHSGDRQSDVVARADGQAGRGSVPGARPQQRAGRSHHGHLGTADHDSFSTSLAAEFNFEPPRESWSTTLCTRSRRCTTARPKSSSRWAEIFCPRRRTRNSPPTALRRCRLTAHVSTKLNRAHLITGQQALILPCLGRTEIDQQATGPQFVTTENSMAVVEASRGRLEPASEHLLSEPAIVAGLAKATLAVVRQLIGTH